VEVVSHAAFAQLHPTFGHPEAPERLAVLLEAFPDFVSCEPATKADLLRCHSDAYLHLIRSIEKPTWLDLDTVASATTYTGAALAAGAAIEAARRGGLALVRPPGHHALPERAMGFCLFDNVAIAARWAQSKLAISRVAIVDFDVHHGNGTQEIFRGDDTVLFVSLHQWPFWPGTGGPDDQAATTLNVPMRAGSGDDDYESAFDRVVEPALARFEPELVLVSAGFDAHVDDPLATCRVSEAGYAGMTASVRRAADAVGAPVGIVLEGGYDLGALSRSMAALMPVLLADEAPALQELAVHPLAARALERLARYFPGLV
jgi:acetoin utilization deacetylase AcuC-like enzyme